jgi:hypothetical protein
MSIYLLECHGSAAVHCSYIVQHIGPALQGDTLEDCQDADTSMIEHGDAIVWRLTLEADGRTLTLWDTRP